MYRQATNIIRLDRPHDLKTETVAGSDQFDIWIAIMLDTDSQQGHVRIVQSDITYIDEATGSKE